MNIIDVNGELTIAALGYPAAQTTTYNGTGVDVSAMKGILKVTQEVGTVSGTTPNLVGKIQDSADNSSFADVTNAAFAAVTTANNIQSIGVDSRAVRKYIRYVGTITGTTPSFTLGVNVVGQKQYL
jgi:hypothetical protein